MLNSHVEPPSCKHILGEMELDHVRCMFWRALEQEETVADVCTHTHTRASPLPFHLPFLSSSCWVGSRMSGRRTSGTSGSSGFGHFFLYFLGKIGSPEKCL